MSLKSLNAVLQRPEQKLTPVRARNVQTTCWTRYMTREAVAGGRCRRECAVFFGMTRWSLRRTLSLAGCSLRRRRRWHAKKLMIRDAF